MVFQLSNDVAPERKPTLDLPELDVAVNPARSSAACTSGTAIPGTWACGSTGT